MGFLPASTKSAAFSGRLADAVDDVLGSLTSADDEIALHELIKRVSKELGNNRPFEFVYRLPPDAILKNREALGGTMASTERGREAIEEVLRSLPIEVRTHFLSKAQGTEIDAEDWYFEGRETETIDLVHWLNTAAAGLYVVTGWAGSGKSAFLGRLVVFAEPALRQALIEVGAFTAPDPQYVPDASFDAVIHLTAKTFHDVLGRITEMAFRLTGEDLTGKTVDEVPGALGTHPEPVTILADALDEALDPIPIAESLLRPLAAIPRVKVVVGTRRSLDEDPDQPRPETHELITALGIRLDAGDDGSGRSTLVTLENDQEAIQRYVRRRLRIERSPYDAEAADRIAVQVIDRKEPFLFARLATSELLARSALTDQQVSELLASGHRGIFAAALGRLDDLSIETVPLLRALAYSLGRGFPQRGRIWATVAEALHHFGAERVDAEDAALDRSAQEVEEAGA